MIARMDKTHHFADSLSRNRTTYSFSTKTYPRMVPGKLQKTDKLYGFYAFLSTILLFNVFQKNLNNIHDVHVSILISSFM